MRTKNELKSIFLNALQLPENVIRTEKDLDNHRLLNQALENEDLGFLTLMFAMTDLCSHVGINAKDHVKVLEELSNKSINDIVSFFYQKQRKSFKGLKQFIVEKFGIKSSNIKKLKIRISHLVGNMSMEEGIGYWR